MMMQAAAQNETALISESDKSLQGSPANSQVAASPLARFLSTVTGPRSNTNSDR